MQIVDLAAAQQLAQDRFLDHGLLLDHDKGLDRQAACGRCGDDRQVAHAGKRHVQGARDWGGGQGQHIDFAAQCFQCLLLAHAKAVLFVDDHQAEILELDVALQQLVGADHDVDLALGQFGGRGFDFLGGFEARHDFHAHRPVGEAVLEAVVVLLGEQGGRHQHRNLLAAVHCEEGRAHGDLGLAEADIAADQAVHRLRAGHVLEYRLNGGQLVGGFLKREVVGKALVVLFRVGEAEALARGAAGIYVEQFGSDIANFLGGLATRLLPLIRAQAVQWRTVVIAAGIAGNQVQVGDRHVQGCLVGVLQYQKLGLLIFNGQVGKTPIAADAVVDMNHRRAFAQLGQVSDDRVAQIGRLATAAALHDTLAEQLAFGNQGNGGTVDQHALVERRDSDGDGAAAGAEGRPAVDVIRFDPDAGEQLGQRFAASGGLGDKQGASRVLLQEALKHCQRVFQLIVDRQVGRQRAIKYAGLRFVRTILMADNARMLFEQRKGFLYRQKQFAWRQQRASWVYALFAVAGAYVLPEVLGVLLDAGQGEQPGIVRQVVEQAGQFVEEQRQIVLNAWWNKAFAEVHVQRATPMIHFKAFAKARAKASQRRLVERELLGRQQVDAVYLVDRALGFRIKGAQRLDLVVQQVDAVGQCTTHWIKIQQRSAYRVVSVFVDRVDAAVAGRVEVDAHPVDVQLLANLQQQDRAAQKLTRRQPVQHRGHGYNKDALADARQLEQRFKALGDDVLVRRETVVRQGFPVGEADDGELWCEKAQLLLETVGGSGVGCDHQAQAVVLLGTFGDGQGASGALQAGPVQAVAGGGRQWRR